MLTGYVVDFEVMSKVCRHCSVAKNKLGQSSAKFSIWYEGHKSECDINHLGSSTSMEMEAALTLWKRSTSLGFRYITVLSDGDCKTFNYLCEKKVYGPDIVIKKEECINHVSKRLGTALRSTVKRLSCSRMRVRPYVKAVTPKCHGGPPVNRDRLNALPGSKARQRILEMHSVM
ncbi:uncharacterized protein TNCV_2576481 [Trichonephila clavipes]|uniref:Mutator-like transposase domain-containing protein n=1 Tax=Trichonephila clavipes TaxID=2585209 RepID=A0A8X6RBZ0_TRICX|nr:uncharacterized protein TNCV_2576481 [Trichonephila clavipes]